MEVCGLPTPADGGVTFFWNVLLCRVPYNLMDGVAISSKCVNANLQFCVE